MFVLQTGLFCGKCGAYSFSRTCKLAADCKGRPHSKAAAIRLARLYSGRHPILDKQLGYPRQLGDPAEALYVEL